MSPEQMAKKLADILTGPAGTGWVESVSVLEPDKTGARPLGVELESGDLWFITIEPA